MIIKFEFDAYVLKNVCIEQKKHHVSIEHKKQDRKSVCVICFDPTYNTIIPLLSLTSSGSLKFLIDIH